MAGASDVPLIYECLDINGALCREGRKADAMRAAEQFLLRRIQMLVVSSPGFIGIGSGSGRSIPSIL